MTISNASNRVTSVGPGDSFVYNKPVFDLDDIYVEIMLADGTLVIPVKDGAGTYDFTVSGTYDTASFRYPSGVTLTLNTSLASSSYSIVIENRVSPVQASDYITGGPVPSERLETDLDRLVVMAQSPVTVYSDLVRVTPTANITVPPLIPAASKYLRWNVDGDEIEAVTLGDGSLIALPLAVADGGFGGDTPAEARTNLDLFEDVFTARGDLLVEGAASEERLAVGANNTWLTSDGTDPSWSALPDASTTVSGVAELATTAEVTTATATDKIVTPANLSGSSVVPKGVYRVTADSSSPVVNNYLAPGASTPSFAYNSSGNYTLTHGFTFTGTTYMASITKEGTGITILSAVPASATTLTVALRTTGSTGVDTGSYIITIWGDLA